MRKLKSASTKVPSVAKAAIEIARKEAERVAAQVALGVADELRKFHEERLLSAVAKIADRMDKRDVFVEETFSRIFKRLEDGDARFDFLGGETKTLTGQMAAMRTAVADLSAKLEASEGRILLRFDEVAGQLQSQQKGIVEEQGRMREVHNMLQGFGELVVRAERALKPLDLKP